MSNTASPSLKRSSSVFLACLIASHLSSQSAPLFTAFQQDSESNCASIALIKAMMGTYGVANVYNRLPSRPGEHVYRLKDGSEVILTQAELTNAIGRTGFKKPDNADPTICAYADTCYAIMAKKRMHVRNSATFQISLDSLSDGYPTVSVGELLGVELVRIRPQRPGKIKELKHIIVYNTYHAVYASEGLYDESKKNGAVRIAIMRWCRAGPKTGFGIRGLSGALRIAAVDP